MSKCKSCKHWNMEHTLEDHNGCRVWNNYKHLGQPPMQPTEGITCEQCGHHNSIIGRNLTEEEYHKAKADAFELNLINDGPTEPFEGWVRGMGIGLVNNSIITKSEDTCKYYKARELTRTELKKLEEYGPYMDSEDEDGAIEDIVSNRDK